MTSNVLKMGEKRVPSMARRAKLTGFTSKDLPLIWIRLEF